MSYNEIAVRELQLFIENDGRLYRQRTQPIIENLAKKKVKGTYDADKAITLWKYLSDDGAKKYVAENFSPQDSMNGMRAFSVDDRKEVARRLAESYSENVEDFAESSRKPVVNNKRLGSTESYVRAHKRKDGSVVRAHTRKTSTRKVYR